MTAYKRGSIYTANLNPQRKKHEPGKTRPVLVVQTDNLNSAKHPTTLVAPLTTQLEDGFVFLRYRVTKRQQLDKDSDLLLDQVRAIDNSRFTSEKVIATLKPKELDVVTQRVYKILGE